MFRKTKELTFLGSKLLPVCWEYSVLADVMDFFVQLKDFCFENETARSLFHHDSREAYISLDYRQFFRITLRQETVVVLADHVLIKAFNGHSFFIQKGKKHTKFSIIGGISFKAMKKRWTSFIIVAPYHNWGKRKLESPRLKFAFPGVSWAVFLSYDAWKKTTFFIYT